MNRIIRGDSIEVLKTMPDESVDCVVTSPPYWALRDYGMEGQLGLERTVEEYIRRLCAVFDEVQRILKTKGTCWVNLGDTYGSGSGNGVRMGKQATNRGTQNFRRWAEEGKPAVKGSEKCLLQIPARFALEMCQRGWILRNQIIWHKPNCMPSSVKDRFTVDFEHIFFFVKSRRYWFETQHEPSRTAGSRHVARHGDKGSMLKRTVNPTYFDRSYETGSTRHKRCVWMIPPGKFRGAHFAVFPPRLIETPVRAGCPDSVCRRCGRPAGPEQA
ncbi:MAG: site-specific DNA-methyltransferase [Candidatus Rokubacteria bacterium]|nr:site-specific DNA-methyltransferase [Candidatus Rokubacteria bacterium]